MSITRFIATRYLFSRSRMGAVNWVSGISTVAIAVVSMALIIALSVYNGYVRMIYEGIDLTTPDLVIEPRAGTIIDLQPTSSIAKALESECVAYWSPLIRYRGVLRSDRTDCMVEAVGVENNYWHQIASDSLLLDGRPPMQSQERGELVVGLGIASSLNEYATSERRIYFPKRQGLINPLAPNTAFRSMPVDIVGYLNPLGEGQSQQIYTHISVMRDLLDLEGHEATSIAIRLKKGIDEADAKRELTAQLGDATYKVLDRAEQQPELTFLIRMEKLMVFLIMIFVLVLAAFNLINGLVMLIMEKQQDLFTLGAMGLTNVQTGKIFALSGLMISLLGSVAGLSVGLILCFLQEKYGWLQAGNGLTSTPYPIDIYSSDVLLILMFTTFISCVISIIPTVIFRRNTAR